MGLRRPTAPVNNYDGNKLPIKHTRSWSLQRIVLIAKSKRLNWGNHANAFGKDDDSFFLLLLSDLKRE